MTRTDTLVGAIDRHHKLALAALFLLGMVGSWLRVIRSAR